MLTNRMTAAQFKATKRKGVKRVKNAKSITVDGIKFDSKREAGRWAVLCAMQERGEICKLERQVPINLIGQRGPILTPTGRPMRSVIDFRYIDWSRDGVTIYEDAKGFQTDVSKIKYAILAAMGYEIALS